MREEKVLAERFEAERVRLRSVAYRMLGTIAEAEDAVQEAWFKLSRSDVSEVKNLGAWLTTVVGRLCLDMLRSRASRREDPLPEQDGRVRLPDPVVSGLGVVDPEQEIMVADSVGIALMVVLETLSPAERLAFVLHDMFDVPFEDIASVLGRTSASTRQLASRARRRVQGSAPAPQPDLARQREVVEAFLAASRGGDFEALVSVLDPEVVLRADAGALAVGAAASKVLRGRERVAESAFMFRQFSPYARPVLVNGSVGLVTVLDGKAVSVMGLTVGGGRITGMYILSDPDRVARLDLASVVEEQGPE